VSLADREELATAWKHAEEKRIGLIGDGTAAQLEVTPEDYAELLEAVSAGASVSQIGELARSWSLEPARQRLGRIAEQARGLARRLNKGEISVRVEANGLRLPPKALNEFWGSFSHLVRNAIDHGLEGEEERLKVGKSPAGCIVLRAAVQSDRLLVEIEDDGRGIDWRALIDRTAALGMPAKSREDLVAALFKGGISTKTEVTEIGGRGIGVSAVYNACQHTGGTVRVQSEPGEGTRFLFSWPASVLSEPVVAEPEPALPLAS
jgi:two-component system chemotaxis sensor kinase CheA